MIENFGFSGAQICEARLGPRRELSLAIEIWPKGKHGFGGGPVVTILLGAIANYEEVRRFFTAAGPPFEELHYLRYVIKPAPGRHVIEMEFDRTGNRVRIVAGKVSLSEMKTEASG